MASLWDFWRFTSLTFSTGKPGLEATSTVFDTKKLEIGTYIAPRARTNLTPNKLGDVRAWVYSNQYDPVRNPEGIVALAIAENKLMREEITQHINTNLKTTPWHLTYGEGPLGTTALRTSLTTYINPIFRPTTPISPQHICMVNGAGSAVSNFAFCVGEPGDGILLSKPLYTGFFSDVQASSKVNLVQVPMEGIDPLSIEAVAQYEKQLQLSQANGTKIRAILLANPHNPLGKPYPKSSLEAFARFCNKHDLHLLSDEVYAQSHFPSTDIPTPLPFTSILSLDLPNLINPALVHVIYAMSKDFGANGIRIGSFISPSNPEMLKAFRSIAGFTRPSQLAEQVWFNLLQDTKFLKWYFPELRKRLGESYEYVTKRLKEYDIPYTPASTGVCVWIDMSKFLGNATQEAELELNWRLARAGVWIAMGATFGSEENGNFRITFATPREDLELGLDRMFGVLDDVLEERKRGKEEL